MIPINSIQLSPEVEEPVLEILRPGMTARWPRDAELRQRFAEIAGFSHAIANHRIPLAAQLDHFPGLRNDEPNRNRERSVILPARSFISQVVSGT